MFKDTLKKISYIVAETRLWRKPECAENTTELSQITDKLYYIMLYRVHFACARFEFTILVVIGTDCIDSCKFNYHMITTMTAHESM